MAFAAFFRRALRHPAARRSAVAVLALASLPALADNAFPDAPGSVEARVDRLLWNLVNDERYSHLQIAANYERLRTQLLGEVCPVSASPCLQNDASHPAQSMTTEITPEQQVILEQLLQALRNASAANSTAPAHMMVSTAE